YIPYPATWLNEGRWKEAPKETAIVPANGTSPRISREDERRERSQQAIENVLGHRSGLVERLRAGVQGNRVGGTHPRLSNGVGGPEASGRSTPSLSASDEAIEVSADAGGNNLSVRSGVRQIAQAEGATSAARGSDDGGRGAGVRAGDEQAPREA